LLVYTPAAAVRPQQLALSLPKGVAGLRRPAGQSRPFLPTFPTHDRSANPILHQPGTTPATLAGLYRFVTRQLAIRQAVGDLRPGELIPEDIVDEILLRAYREFARDHTGRAARGWMLRLAGEQVESRISRSRTGRDRPAGREEPSEATANQ
jgi:hypothetical protein